MVSLARLRMMEEGLIVGRAAQRGQRSVEETYGDAPIYEDDTMYGDVRPAPAMSGSMLEYRFRAIAAEARARAAWMSHAAAEVACVERLCSLGLAFVALSAACVQVAEPRATS